MYSKRRMTADKALGSNTRQIILLTHGFHFLTPNSYESIISIAELHKANESNIRDVRIIQL